MLNIFCMRCISTNTSLSLFGLFFHFHHDFQNTAPLATLETDINMYVGEKYSLLIYLNKRTTLDSRIIFFNWYLHARSDVQFRQVTQIYRKYRYKHADQSQESAVSSV